jgi:hypothetical protein
MIPSLGMKYSAVGGGWDNIRPPQLQGIAKQ